MTQNTAGELYADVGTCAHTGRPVRLHYNTFGRRTAPRGDSPSQDNNNNYSTNTNSKDEVQLPCILLIMDFGDATLRWEDAFCAALAAAGPFFVVRFDTRDAGLSTQFPQVRQDSNATTHTSSSNSSSNGGDAPPSLTGKAHGATTSTRELLDDVLNEDNMQTSKREQAQADTHDSTTMVNTSASSGFFSALKYLKYLSMFLQRGQLSSEATYTLEDMTADTFGLLDHLQLTRVHLVGISLGGMIAQCMAVQQPGRVASLTLIATHSSEPGLVQWPSLRHLLSLAQHIPSIAKATPRAERVRLYAAGFTRFVQRLSGDAARYAFDQPAMQARLRHHFEQNPSLRGIGRQLAALLHAKGRDAQLRQCITSVPPQPSSCTAAKDDGEGEGKSEAKEKTREGQRPVYIPTLIVHGTEDILYPADNATHLSRVIAGSTLVMIEGMGHVVLPSLYGRFVELIADNVRRGEAHGGGPGSSCAKKQSATAATAQSHL